MTIGSLDTKRLPPGAVLVVGAGLAGLYLALKLAPRQVYVLTSRRSSVGAASAWAQGGIAAALSPEDSPESHARDTIAAGDGFCLLYTSPSPRDATLSRMPSSA